MEEHKSEECAELKNLKYKTMLLSGVPIKETNHQVIYLAWKFFWKVKKIQTVMVHGVN